MKPGSPAKPRQGLFYRCLGSGGLIDLNSASTPLLATGFAVLGYDGTQASRLAAGVEDYRALGSARPDENLSSALPLKHAPFDNIAELYDLIPDKDASSMRISEIFTVFNKTEAVVLSKGKRCSQAKAHGESNAARVCRVFQHPVRPRPDHRGRI